MFVRIVLILNQILKINCSLWAVYIKNPNTKIRYQLKFAKELCVFPTLYLSIGDKHSRTPKLCLVQHLSNYLVNRILFNNPLWGIVSHTSLQSTLCTGGGGGESWHSTTRQAWLLLPIDYLWLMVLSSDWCYKCVQQFTCSICAKGALCMVIAFDWCIFQTFKSRL